MSLPEVNGISVPPKERIFPVIGLLIGAVSLMFYLLTYEKVQSEASIDFKMDRNQAIAQSKALIEQQGYDLSGYQNAIGFYTEDDTLKFLQKEADPADAGRLMRGEVLVWYWYVRWFVPGQEEEFGVGYQPDGRLVIYRHHVPENNPGSALDEEGARATAAAFLAQSAGIDIANGYAEKASSEKKLPQRMQHSLTWERSDFDLKNAKYRIYTTIDGDKVGYYTQGLHIPEQWTSEETRKNSQRWVLAYVGRAGKWVFSGALFVMLLIRLRSQRLRMAFAAGLAALVATVMLLSGINSLPGAWMGYDTTETVITFYVGLLVRNLTGIFSGILGILILAIPAESAGREIFPQHIPLSRMTLGPSWASKDIFRAVIVGLCLALCNAAYYAGFYLLATQAGAWCPLASPPLNAIATPMPWIYPLQTGIFAALNEELLFRLFAISWLLRWLRRPWIAVTIPAVVWALLHSGYPQEPIFIRTLELVPVGIVFGLVFMRYGILATLVGHYTYNALASSDFMLRSGRLSLVIPCAFILGLMALMLLPGIVRILCRKPLFTREEVLAFPERRFRLFSLPDEGKKPSDIFCQPYEFLPRKRMVILGLLAVVMLFLYVALPRPERFGDFVRVSINRNQALDLADAYMRDRGVAVNDYQRIVSFVDYMNGNDADYVYEKAGLTKLNALFHTYPLPTVRARVRYFKPREIEQYRVELGPDGKVEGYTHWLEETAPGARLSQEEARRRAEQYLREEKGITLDGYALVDAHSKEYEARTDHWFKWEDGKNKIEDAAFRISLEIMGDEPNAFKAFIKVPEKWIREREEKTWKDAVQGILAAIMGIGFMLYVANSLYRIAKHGYGSCWFASCVGIIALASSILSSCNMLGLFWNDYDVDSSPYAYLFASIAEWFLFAPGVTFIALSIFALLADGMWRRYFPQFYPLGYWFGLARLYRHHPNRPAEAPRLPLKKVWAEAILLGFSLAVILLSFDILLMVPEKFFSESSPESVFDTQSAPAAETIGGHASYLPAIDTLLSGIDVAEFTVILLFLGVVYYRHAHRRPIRVIGLAALLIVLALLNVSGGIVENIEFCCLCLMVLILFWGVCRAVVKGALRENIPAYVMLLFFGVVIDEISILLRESEPFAFWNGVGLAVFLAAWVLWALLVYCKKDFRDVPGFSVPKNTPEISEDSQVAPASPPGLESVALDQGA